MAAARQYFEQAARKGHVDAAATLGILLFQNGDRSGAMRWLKLAADGGETRAMLLFGTALYNGDGVAPDPVTAYAYVSRAAAQGLDIAKRRSPISTGRCRLAAPEGGRPGQGDGRRQGRSAQGRRPARRAKAALAGGTARIAVGHAAPRRSGGWRIQLGAFGQRAAAEALFARLRGKVGARQPYYVPAGKVVRLQVGPFESRAAAAAGCAALGGQACFPVAAR